MHFWSREFVNGALRLAVRQSYRIIRPTPSGRISSDSVLAILNRSRIGIAEPVATLPCDLMTADEAVSRFGVTKRELRRWSRRSRHVVPHFRLNKNTIRFSEELLGRWLTENSAA